MLVDLNKLVVHIITRVMSLRIHVYVFVPLLFFLNENTQPRGRERLWVSLVLEPAVVFLFEILELSKEKWTPAVTVYFLSSYEERLSSACWRPCDSTSAPPAGRLIVVRPIYGETVQFPLVVKERHDISQQSRRKLARCFWRFSVCKPIYIMP